jgi:ABC-type phosphate transport system substrate-binding protein
MKIRIRSRRRAGKAAMFFSLLLQLIFFPSLSNAQDVIIIANKDVPVDSLSRNEIKSIFLGEKIKWDNDRKITFVILKTEAHDVFLKEYIGNTAAQYLNYWKKMVFTGKSKSPKSFKDTESLIDYIAETGGAVSYLPASAYNDKVKIISVK